MKEDRLANEDSLLLEILVDLQESVLMPTRKTGEERLAYSADK